MNILKSKFIAAACVISLLISCNEKNNTGNTTPEGTQLEDQRPNQNETSMSGNVDTITSPGSNSTDANMQNQSGTHGTDTQSGDNGTGSGAAQTP